MRQALRRFTKPQTPLKQNRGLSLYLDFMLLHGSATSALWSCGLSALWNGRPQDL